jgi:DNA polymerase III alpha subunit (gram-positive type)
MSERYIAFDTETGGLSDDSSLLSLYIDVLDENLSTIDSIYLFTKPNDSVYRVEAGGLFVNKINLIEHDKIAKTYSSAGQELVSFLKKNSDNGKIKLIPLGKNIHFDVEKVTDNLVGKKTWGNYVSYRVIDVTTLARCLQIKGKLPKGMSLSLNALAQHLWTEFDTLSGELHTADYDTRLTVLVFRKLLELV